MSITTKPPASPGNPTSKTTIAEETAGNPTSKTTISESTAGNATSKTTISEASAGNATAKTTVSEASAGNPTSKTTIAESTAGNATVKTTIPAAAFPRTSIPLVDMHFDTNSYSQNGDPVLFGDLFTYSRSSSATFINRRIVNNKPEFFLDTDFVGNVTNLALFSEQFDNASWVKANATVLANNDFNADGFKIADRLHPATTGTLRGISQAITATTAEHNVSFRVKSAGFKWIKIFDAANTNGAWFNVATGVIGTITGNCEPSIIPLGDDWYRCSIGDAGAVSGFANIILADADNSTTATLSGIDGVLLDASQLTLGVKPLPYVKTISSTVLQAFTETLRVEYDPATGDNLGSLIESASTNLILRSEKFDTTWAAVRASIVANSIKAPDGTISGDVLVEDATASNSHLTSQSVTVTASTNVTFSLFAKAKERNQVGLVNSALATVNAEFDLLNGVVLGQGAAVLSAKIKDAGDGWFRCSMTYDSGAGGAQNMRILLALAGSTTYSGDGTSGAYINNAQVEELESATSYIRTEGSTVSRTADVLSISYQGNVPKPNDKLSIATEFDFVGDPMTTARLVWSTNHSSTFANRTLQDSLRYYRAGVADVSAGTVFGETKYFSVCTWDGASSGDLFLNNTAFAADEIHPDDSATLFNIGNLSNILQLNGHIKSMQIYDVELTAQEVALL